MRLVRQSADAMPELRWMAITSSRRPVLDGTLQDVQGAQHAPDPRSTLQWFYLWNFAAGAIINEPCGQPMLSTGNQPMLAILNIVLAELLPGFATALSNIDTALSLGPR